MPEILFKMQVFLIYKLYAIVECFISFCSRNALKLFTLNTVGTFFVFWNLQRSASIKSYHICTFCVCNHWNINSPVFKWKYVMQDGHFITYILKSCTLVERRHPTEDIIDVLKGLCYHNSVLRIDWKTEKTQILKKHMIQAGRMSRHMY